jgi:DnaJ-class molecular chaperone
LILTVNGHFNDGSIGAVFQEVEMVCVVCNGKGYVIEGRRELVCSECQGRGECFLFDSDRHIKQKPQEVHEAR